MSSNNEKGTVTDAIEHPPALKLFLKKFREFEAAFCKSMYEGADFTIRFEVRGNKRELLHARVYTDNSERPNGAQKRIDEKSKRGASVR